MWEGPEFWEKETRDDKVYMHDNARSFLLS